MKIVVLIILFLAFYSCENENEIKSKSKEFEELKLHLEPNKVEKEKNFKNLNLTSFLENPIDLQSFKRKTKRNVTSSVTNGLNYYYNPQKKDSIFYCYNFISRKNRQREINIIVVFKYGENKHKYEDKTEILIELKINNIDADLGKANLIGLSKTELESEFGTDYLTFDNGIAYSNNNKILIIEFDNSKVKSFRYLKLNTENVDQDLISQINE